MPTLQVQARALGDPTRHDVFRYVADASTPVGVAELTEHFGLNHNAIRQHLSKLVDAELILEATARPIGRGRPRLQYTVNPAAESRWGVTGPYERLSMLLAEIVSTGEEPIEVGRRAGLRENRSYLSEPGGRTSGQNESANGPTGRDALDEFVEAMAREGFAPALRTSGDSVEVRLDECPFASAALANPDAVCELHLGMAKGVAEALGGIEVEELRPNDPRKAHCLLRCHVTKG